MASTTAAMRCDRNEARYDVCTAAYVAARPTTLSIPSTPDVCARCARVGSACVPASKIISRAFTAFDSWQDPTRTGLCFVCAWIYREPALRSAMHLVTTTPSLSVLTSRDLAAYLAGPIADDHALVVPLRPGRKHLFPAARWGAVAVDDITVEWSGSDAATLHAMQRLRVEGFSQTALSAAAPPYAFLQKVALHKWGRVLDDWEQLKRWRSEPPWWELGLRASVPTKVSA